MVMAAVAEFETDMRSMDAEMEEMYQQRCLRFGFEAMRV